MSRAGPAAGRGCLGQQSLTSAGQPHVRVGVHEEPQVEHVPDVLAVENQDPLEEDHVSRVDHRGLCQPAREKNTQSTPQSSWAHPQAHPKAPHEARTHLEWVTKS